MRDAGTNSPDSQSNTNARRNNTGYRTRGYTTSTKNVEMGRLTPSFSGPLDSPSPAKSCFSLGLASDLVGYAKRSGSYDLGKLNIGGKLVLIMEY